MVMLFQFLFLNNIKQVSKVYEVEATIINEDAFNLIENEKDITVTIIIIFSQNWQ